MGGGGGPGGKRGRGTTPRRTGGVGLGGGAPAFPANEPLQQAFGQLTAGTELEGAELVVERVRATLVCPGRGHEGPVALPEGAEDDHHNLPPMACPECGELPEITSGSGVVIRDLELEVEDTAEA